MIVGNTLVMIPKKINGRRSIVCQGQPIQQLLIKWQDLPNEEAMWEDTVQIHQAYPSFNIEVNVALKGESSAQDRQALISDVENLIQNWE